MVIHRKGAPSLSGATDHTKEKADQADISKTKEILKNQGADLDKKIKTLALTMENPTKFTSLKAKIQTYFKNAADKLKPGITIAQLTSMKEKITTDIVIFNEQIMSEAEILRNADTSQKVIQAYANEYVEKILFTYISERAPKNKLVYLASAYLLRWENANNKEIGKITDIDVSRRVLSDISTGKGPIFRDLRKIIREIQTICGKWNTPDKKENSEVFSDEKTWTEQYEGSIALDTGSSFWDAASKGSILGGSLSLIAGPEAVPVGSVVGGLVGGLTSLTTGPKYKEIKTSEADVMNYLAWARKQAKDGKFPPLPDMLRENGLRQKMQIIPAIKREQIKKKITFIKEIYRLQANISVLAQLDAAIGLTFAKPILDRFETHATINIMKDDQAVGQIIRKNDYNTELRIGNKKYNVSLNSPESIIDLIKKELNL